MKQQFEDSEQELLVYMTSSVALRGQTYERNGGTCHEPDRVEKGVLELISRNGLDLVRKVHVTIALVSPRSRFHLHEALAPRRSNCWDLFVGAFGKYAGLAPHTRAALRAYHAQAGTRALSIAPTSAEIVDFLERNATTGKKKLGNAIAIEIEKTMLEALGEYDPLRQRRVAIEERVRAEDIAERFGLSMEDAFAHLRAERFVAARRRRRASMHAEVA